MKKQISDAIELPPSDRTISQPINTREKGSSADRGQARARPNAWHSSPRVHGRNLVSKTSQGRDAANDGQRQKHRQTNSLSPPRSCPSRAWPPLFISHASQTSAGRDRTGPAGAVVETDTGRDELQKHQLEQLDIVSLALDELGAVILRATVADELRNERHRSECKEHESKAKQLKQACRQLQRDERAMREARTDLARQMSALQLQYRILLECSEKQRAKGEAASRKYDALVLKSVSLMQQLEGRL